MQILHTILTIPYLHFVGGYTIFSLNNKGTFCVGVQFFPLNVIGKKTVWGYTVFPLNNKGTYCVGVHSFSP